MEVPVGLVGAVPVVIIVGRRVWSRWGKPIESVIGRTIIVRLCWKRFIIPVSIIVSTSNISIIIIVILDVILP